MTEITNENYREVGVRIFDSNGNEITPKQKIIGVPIKKGSLVTLGKTDVELYYNLLNMLKTSLVFENSEKSILITILKIFNTLFDSLTFDYKSYFFCFNNLIESIRYYNWDLKHSHGFDFTELEPYNIYLEWLNIQEAKFNVHKEIDKINKNSVSYKNDHHEFISNLLIAANQLQGHQVNFKSLDKASRENTYNKQIAQTLCNRNYFAKDQSEHGASGTGKTIGHPDITVNDKQGKTITIVEALIIRSIVKKSIIDHLNRLFNYDPHILSSNFLIVYVETPKEKFNQKFLKYLEFIENAKVHFPLIELQIIPPYNLKLDSSIRLITSRYRINEETEVKVYHLLINMNLIV